jgi:hypothetical protein
VEDDDMNIFSLISLWEVIVLTILSGLGGLLYRLGGIGDPFNTKYRDFGVPIIGMVYMFMFNEINWTIILSGVLCFAAQTTYFKGEAEDVLWYHWFFVGLAFSLCWLPYIFFNMNWIGFYSRALIVTSLIPLWSLFIDDDTLEEFGRGVIQIITLILI